MHAHTPTRIKFHRFASCVLLWLTHRIRFLGGWVFGPSCSLVPVIVCYVAVSELPLDKEMKGYRESGEGPGTRRIPQKREQARSQELWAGLRSSETEARSVQDEAVSQERRPRCDPRTNGRPGQDWATPVLLLVEKLGCFL